MLGMIVGADVGNQDSKFYTQGKSLVLPSYACRARLREIDNIKDEYHIRINGDVWWTGELARMESGTREIEKNKLMRYSNLPLILTGIAALMTESTAIVNVVGGTPISDYSDTSLSLKDALRKTWIVELCGIQKTIHISNVLTMPEGASAAFALVMDDMGKAHSIPDLMRVIDIGSKTTNFATFRKMKYVANESGTLPLGTTSAQLETYRRVSSRLDVLPDEVVPDNVACNNLAVRIRSEINKWWRVWDGDICLAGGGATVLRDYFDEYHIPTDPQLLTAIGNYRVGAAKWTLGQ